MPRPFHRGPDRKERRECQQTHAHVRTGRRTRLDDLLDCLSQCRGPRIADQCADQLVHGAAEQAIGRLTQQVCADVRRPRQQRAQRAAKRMERRAARCTRMRRTEHGQDADQHIIARRRAPRAAADDTRDDIVERIGVAQSGHHGACHSDGAVPGQRARQPPTTTSSRLPSPDAGLSSRAGVHRGRGATVDDNTSTPWPNAHEPRSDIDGVAAAQTESVEIHRRDTDAEREVCPLGGQQRPHVAADLEIHRVREHAVNTT